MSYSVSLVEMTPPSRADAQSYTSVRIEESESAGGPWSTIDTKATGPDGDPANPATRQLTTAHAALAEGWYRVTWIAAGDTSTPSEPMENASQLAGGVRPTIAEVAAKVRARTKVRGGTEVGTFNTVTRPTAVEVDALIDEALDEVLGKVQTPEPGTAYERRVRGAVCLYTAILIELSYFPEQVGSSRSPATTYQALYASRIKALIAEGETGKPQGEGGSADAPADAYWTFPATDGNMIGLGTAW